MRTSPIGIGMLTRRMHLRVKEAVSNTPVLRFFDAGKAPTIQCDASSTGLGTVLSKKVSLSHTQVVHYRRLNKDTPR